MTQEQMIEMVKQHHPEKSETQIRIYLNDALKEFARRTRILTDKVTFNTVANQRYYTFPNINTKLIEVEDLWFDSYAIPRLLDRPIKRDSS